MAKWQKNLLLANSFKKGQMATLTGIAFKFKAEQQT